jgi:NADPH-dependent curcumin reductase CurA
VSSTPSQSADNRRFVLAKRPDGLPQASDFRLETGPIPKPGRGQFLVRNVYIPVDPGMRPGLSDDTTGVQAFAPVPLGAVVGYLTVGQVVRSEHPVFAPGDWVTDHLLWQDYAVSDGTRARKIALHPNLSPSTACGVLGVPGLSAYFGTLAVAEVKPGDVVLVTSIAGAVGSIAGQIAALKGCRVVGTAGGAKKCAWAKERFGFADIVDYKARPDLAAALREICRDGIDVLFDNVGNAMIDLVLPLMRRNGRIVICGQVADYGIPYRDMAGIRNTNRFAFQQLTLRGLFTPAFEDRYPTAIAEMTDWILDGKLTYVEDIETGFEKLPTAFASLFRGENLGRKLIKTG